MEQCGGKPRRALSSSLHGWPPELELSTSDTPLSAGLGGNEPRVQTYCTKNTTKNTLIMEKTLDPFVQV